MRSRPFASQWLWITHLIPNQSNTLHYTTKMTCNSLRFLEKPFSLSAIVKVATMLRMNREASGSGGGGGHRLHYTTVSTDFFPWCQHHTSCINSYLHHIFACPLRCYSCHMACVKGFKSSKIIMRTVGNPGLCPSIWIYFRILRCILESKMVPVTAQELGLSTQIG